MADERESRRGRLTNALIIGLIALLTPVLLVAGIYWQTGALPQLRSSGPPQLPPPNTLETVTVLAGAPEPVTTAREYSPGEYVLVIEGVLPIDDNRLIDAYYLHTDEFGLALDAAQPIEPPLRVDGRPLAASPPDYDPFHIYAVDYTHPESGPLTFSLERGRALETNEYALRVYITQPGSDGS